MSSILERLERDLKTIEDKLNDQRRDLEEAKSKEDELERKIQELQTEQRKYSDERRRLEDLINTEDRKRLDLQNQIVRQKDDEARHKDR